MMFCGKPADAFASAVLGTEGDDVLVGTGDDDLIRGFGGNDQLLGNGGDDIDTCADPVGSNRTFDCEGP